MGSGNVILNIKSKSNVYIGNDKNKLVPNVLASMRDGKIYNIDKFNGILARWNCFKIKDDYYRFRDYWNSKYFADTFDEDFVYETVMLLKMCSNSMVRFNQSEGKFNQGFRGLSTQQEIEGFFGESMKELCVDGLNDIKNRLNEVNFQFNSKSFDDIDIGESNNLIIADPPYILRMDMYNQNFSQEHDNKLLDMLKTTKNDFIYFNYLSRGDEVNIKLKELINETGFKVIPINSKTSSGQGRTNTKEVLEVIVTNI